MPTHDNRVKFISCSSSSYFSLHTWDQDTLYFLHDTRQLFVGDSEYTKTLVTLGQQPTAASVGEVGRIYVYNGSLYMCNPGELGTYIWTRIANVNDYKGTVTSVTAGAGLDGGNITAAGTISHAVPEGAEERNTTTPDVKLDFGQSFEISDVITDKFGHVTGVNIHKVTLPKKESIEVTNVPSEEDGSLKFGDEFQVITNVERGAKTHQLNVTTRTLKLPEVEDKDTTYTLQTGETSGTVKLIGSDGSTQEVAIKDFELLAKITDVTSIFRYKGSVDTKNELPSNAEIGDVYYVRQTASEYIFLGTDRHDPWEEFGPAIDLSAYALVENVIPRVEGAKGQVAMFNEDGTLQSTGHTLGADVPADAKFTDTVYTHPEFAEHETGLYKVKVSQQGHVSSVEQVTRQDIIDLGISDENTDTQVRTTPTKEKIFLAGTKEAVDTTGELKVDSSVYVEDGEVTAPKFHGVADSAEQASKDGDGRDIKDTYLTKEDADTKYATKDENGNVMLVWQTI